jgi:hypothetical protein
MSKRVLITAVAALAATAGATVAIAGGGGLVLGPAAKGQETTYQGFYDGHKDVYVLTDTSNKAQATAWHINFSAALARFKGAPEQYFVQGKAAPGQLAIFGSEPGEANYNPLWDEVALTWKTGATPVLITSDTQIDKIKKTGKLTEKDLGIVLNAPILSVGK